MVLSNARGYTGLLFATVLATDLLLRGLWQGRWSTWIGYSGVVAVGMGLHLSMVFVVTAHFLVVATLLDQRFQSSRTYLGPFCPLAAFRLLDILPNMPASARLASEQNDLELLHTNFGNAGLVRQSGSTLRWRPGVGFLLATTLTLQLYALVLPQVLAFYTQPSAGAGTGPEEWKSPLWALAETVRGLAIGSVLGWTGLIAAALVLLIGTRSLWRRTPVATWCFVLPAVLGGSTLALLERNLWPRFFFNELGFAALFVVVGTRLLGDDLGDRLRGARQNLGAIFVLALILLSALALPRNYRSPKQDFTGARDWVLAQKAPEDPIGRRGDGAFGLQSSLRPRDGRGFVGRGAPSPSFSRRYDLGHPHFGGHLKANDPQMWTELLASFETAKRFHGTLGGGDVVVLREREGYRPTSSDQETEPQC